jgi:excisionase family DNA binding protein
LKSNSVEIPPKYHRFTTDFLCLDNAAFHSEVNTVTKLLSIREASELLAVKPATIRAWLVRRKLPRVNCGRAVRIPAQAIVQFIERNTIPAREERQ